MIHRLILLYSLLLCCTVGSAQVFVESMIDSTQILVGEQTALHVSATIKKGQRVKFKQWKPLQQIASGVEVVEAPRYDTTDTEDGYIKVTQHLLLTAFEDSLYYIPAQRVNVAGKQYSSKSLALKVLTIPVDTLKPEQFYGAADVQDNPYKWGEWEKLLWISLAAMLLYCIGILAWFRLKSGKPIHLKVRIIKKLPPHKKALDSIEKIKNDGKLVDSKTYYTQLTDTLRKYIEERFKFDAMEMTSTQIVARLKEVGNNEKMMELKTLFETADLVKFAKHEADMNENDRNLVSAIDFINDTKQENVPTEEKIIPKATEQQKQTMRMRLSMKWAIAILTTALAAIVAYVCWLLYDYRY